MKFKGRPLWMQYSKRFQKFWFYNTEAEWSELAWDSMSEFSKMFHHIPRGGV